MLLDVMCAIRLLEETDRSMMVYDVPCPGGNSHPGH